MCSIRDQINPMAERAFENMVSCSWGTHDKEHSCFAPRCGQGPVLRRLTLLVGGALTPCPKAQGASGGRQLPEIKFLSGARTSGRRPAGVGSWDPSGPRAVAVRGTWLSYCREARRKQYFSKFSSGAGFTEAEVRRESLHPNLRDVAHHILSWYSRHSSLVVTLVVTRVASPDRDRNRYIDPNR